MLGRNGDHFIAPFQCETCHFRNLVGRDIVLSRMEDRLLAITMRRASLDVFWAREPSTVRGTSSGLNIISNKLGLVGVPIDRILPDMGPHPLKDSWGMGVAVSLLLRSLDQGVTEDTVQWGTVRKLRGAFSNVWQASIEGPKSTVIQLDTTKLYVTTCPTNSMWFERFTKGIHKRQGDNIQPDMGISLEQMIALMDMFELEWKSEPSQDMQAEILFSALFMLSTFLGGLRGEEVPLMDLAGMRKYFGEGVRHKRYPHVPLAMLGRFKHDGQERYHYIPISAQGGSSLEIRPWVERMFKYYEARGIRSGRVFRNQATGAPAKQGDYEYAILRRLVDIQEKGDGSIISKTDDVFHLFGTGRSGRRGGTSEAGNLGIAKDVIDANNRWSAEERAKGRSAGGSMLMHYTEIRISVGKLIRFSHALLVAAASMTASH